ncbi:DUF1776-domain-containing protein [Saccharata proteae CBS 121410]|uniref:DUF1776-domain-containing protein n=1 Tax=Saccharata proteae CBS 121410 TaxID=1314787 RepID=A0A9P4LV43_9PEZI|nr:DUF1776-domain-containing protein [Saccharata proteae CBS 121410]
MAGETEYWEYARHLVDGISNEVKTLSSYIAESTDSHFENVAASIRDTLATASWLPAAARPSPPPPAIPKIPATYLARVQEWVSRNRAITAAVVAFLGTGTFLVWQKKKAYNRKRRARRASNGARREVVVIAGPPASPITKSISLDLERRGFIVYVVAGTLEEERLIQGESRVDIRPLGLDISDTLSAQEAIERFHSMLLSPHKAFAGASAHNLDFAGLILVPDLIYPSGPVETISPEYWSDALNAKVLGTIATAQAFLPTICAFKARVLLLTPSIVSSLRPPFHGVESVVCSALDGFASSLTGELDTLGIQVCQLKLGTFDCSGVGSKQYLQSFSEMRTEAWPASARALYAENYGLFGGDGSSAKGSSLRELHNAVFDALTRRQPRRTWRVGRGSVTYDLVGKWVPASLVGWMLGIQARPGRASAAGAEPRLEDASAASSTGMWERVEFEAA